MTDNYLQGVTGRVNTSVNMTSKGTERPESIGQKLNERDGQSGLPAVPGNTEIVHALSTANTTALLCGL
jgi:hypothetical protein